MKKDENLTAVETAEAAADPMEEMVPVMLFKDGETYKDDVFVAVNGRSFQIQRGKTVMVPRYVKEVLDNSQRQERATADLLEQLEQEYENKTKAQGKG